MLLFNLLFFILIPLIFAELNSERKTIDSLADGNRNCRCANEETFDVIFGEFKSPGYPIQYCDLLNCKWHILPSSDTFISASIQFFDIEEKYDVLEIYQTQWNGSELMKVKQASLSGNNLQPKQKYYVSSINGGLLFHFKTDGNEHSLPGFKINFYKIINEYGFVPCPPSFYFATEHPQSLPIIHHSMLLESCAFSINSSSAIKLTINKFYVSYVNKIEVFETESFPNPFLQQQSGQLAKIIYYDYHLFPIIVISRTNSISLIITSSTSNDTIPYEIQFESTESVCSCFPNNLIVSRTQPLNLLSPGYPIEYCDQLNCSTQISLEYPLFRKNQLMLDLDELIETLIIKFNKFHTEVDVDLLRLFTPFNSEMREIVELGGVAKNIKSFTFDSAKFVLNFTTDLSVLDTGFNLTIEAIKKPKECLCHGYSSNLKILTEQKYTENNLFDAKKCTLMDCFWKIEPLKDSEYDNRFIINFNLSITDTTEFVEVCQNNFHQKNPYCYRIDLFNIATQTKFEFFSFQIPGLPYFKQINPIFVWYHRELLNTEELNNPNTPRQINFTYEWRKECNCGNNLLKASINNWKPLFSPDYPETYCHSINCTWNLIAPEGHHIVLNVSEFSTEADQDFVIFFDGNDTTKEHMEMLSGIITFKNTLHSLQNIMTILFTSDTSIQLNGFIIWYKAEPNNLKNNLKSSENSSNSPNRLFLFLLFILFAIIGILFLVARSNSTNNRITIIENFFRNSLPFSWGRLFNENEVNDEGRNQLLENTTPSVHYRSGQNNRWHSFSTNNPFN